jgi:hypothetical protein
MLLLLLQLLGVADHGRREFGRSVCQGAAAASEAALLLRKESRLQGLLLLLGQGEE